MSLASLKGFFQPRSVAVIGASKLADSLGASVLRNLLQAEFDGPILPVNPKHDSVLGVRCYRSIKDLPVVPDLAVLCTPEDTLPGVVERLGRQGTRAAIVMSRGRDPARVTALRSALLAAAAPYGLRMLGPGSDGIQVPSAKLNASWMVGRARPGNVSLISQSGSLIAGMLPWAERRSIGFSQVISHGEGIDVVLGDLLDYVATDPHTHAVLLYLKKLYDSRKFMSAARALARIKPVIAIRPSLGGGETGIVFPGGQVLPGVDPDAVHDVAMQRAGILRVRDIDELFDAAQALTHGRRPAGEHLVILGNGLGPAELALGALNEGGGKGARLSPGTREKLAALTSATAQPDSIVDIGRRATPARYHEAVSVLLADPGVNALLVMHTDTAVAPEEACAAQVIEAVKDSERYVLACWLGSDPRGSAHRRFTEAGIANYPTPEKATRAFLHLVRYQRSQYLLRQTPATPMPDKAAARMRERAGTIIASALGEGRRWLHEEEISQVLECYGIPAVPARLASSPDDAVRLARELGFPVSLHLSMRVPASSKLDSESAVREAAAALFADPGAELPGMPETRVVVHPAAGRPDALILMAGIASNPVFGRVIHLGPGGLQKSSSEGGALSLPPLNMALAEEMISRTGIAHMVAQTFNRSGLDQTALQALLVRLSDIAVDLPEVSVLQINPLLADRGGVLAQEVRLAIEPQQPGRAALSIRPYPSELEEELTLDDGSKVLARPVRPEDEPAYTRLLAQLSPEDIYSRFCRAGPVQREVALELIHIDYDREMTFVGTRTGLDGEAEIVGVVDSMTTPDNREAEYAIFVRSDLKGKGLGRALMEKMIRYCRQRGTGVLFGMVLKSNVAMLSLDFKLGFQPDLAPADAGDAMEKMVLQLA